MAGLDYLVGIRFKAYGNLGESLKKYVWEFADFASVGVAAFAALTDAALQYQKTLALLGGELNNTKLAHKAMAQTLSSKGSSAYLTPGAGASRGALLGNLFGDQGLNKGSVNAYNRTVEMLRGTYHMTANQASSFMSKAVMAGVGFAQTRGIAPGKQESYALSTAQMLAANVGKFHGESQSTYMSSMYAALKSPYAGMPGLSRGTLFGAVGLNTVMQQTHGYGAGATNRLLSLISGHASHSAVSLLMLDHMRLGVNGSLALAVGGHPYKIDKSQMLRYLADPVAFTKRFLPMLETGTPYTGMSLAQIDKNPAAKRAIGLAAAQALKASHSGLYTLFQEGLLLTPHELRRYGTNTTFTNKNDSPLVNAMNSLEASLDKLWMRIGKVADVTGVMQGISKGASWLNTAMGVPAIAHGVLGLGAFGLLGLAKIGSKLGFLGSLKALGTLIGRVSELSMAAYGGWQIGKTLDAVFPKTTASVGKIVAGTVLTVFNAAKVFFAWISGNANSITSALKSLQHSLSFIGKGFHELANLIDPSAHKGKLHSIERKVLNSTYTGPLGDIYATHIGKDRNGELPVDYMHTQGRIHTENHFTVHVHPGESPSEIQMAIVDALKSVVHASGRNTSSSLAHGIG